MGPRRFYPRWSIEALSENGKIDPSFLVTHRIGLEQGPDAYQTFRDKRDGCVKVVIRP